MRSAIERELGARSADVVLDEPPLAEGSIAVIVPFRWHDPAAGTAQHGVFKLLAPGVAERVAEELEILRPLGEFLEVRSAALDLPPLGYERPKTGSCLALQHSLAAPHDASDSSKVQSKMVGDLFVRIRTGGVSAHDGGIAIFV